MSVSPKKSPFIMKWIIWHIPSTSHENDELSCKRVTRQAQTKNFPLSQGNLHTISISSTTATKDRKWVRGHQCIQTEANGWAGSISLTYFLIIPNWSLTVSTGFYLLKNITVTVFLSEPSLTDISVAVKWKSLSWHIPVLPLTNSSDIGQAT